MESHTLQERIGEFLVKMGDMTAEQRDEVLGRQKKKLRRLLGEIGIERGYVNKRAIDTFLGREL